MARDLTHLSLADLLEEARRRGIVGAEAMDREALIDALSEPERRGPMSLARKLLGRVVRAVIPGGPPERRSERPPAPAPSAGPRQPQVAPTLPPRAAEMLLDPAFTGFAAVETSGLAIVWRIPEGALEGAQAIARATAELRLVTVRIRWAGEGVEVSRTDHGAVRTEGALAIDARRPGELVVASIGLGSHDGSFVSAVHARL